MKKKESLKDLQKEPVREALKEQRPSTRNEKEQTPTRHLLGRASVDNNQQMKQEKVKNETPSRFLIAPNKSVEMENEDMYG